MMKRIMKKLSFITLLFCCAFSVKAQNIINGSFELNSAIPCWMGLDSIAYNNTVLYSKNFGDNSSIALFKLPCTVCSPPVLWGGQAKDGDYALVLAGMHETIVIPPPLDTTVHNIRQGKISLALDIPLLDEKRYKLSFWIKGPPSNTPQAVCIENKTNLIEVGISNYEDSLGRHLITTNYGDTIWQEYTYVFETQNAEQHITAVVGLNGLIDNWVFIDDFVLVETTEPLTTGVNESPQQEKQLLKIVDILGKESKSKKGLLFYIYSDGTVEKKLIME